ncbi:hypothetical protein SOCEGT47_042960 [Sorangium cellulosum]|uniref:DUF6968 domain-containing protein n=1 Tax=Sorangium cellulosum TaxID=56 RepID=A0A4P2Q415_SORCE|nr:hypothetical protein [Sorangium cellulosum]AUX23766.1 hypothetical protein SOCEGT47_042960 [Sorangium cellulosum]
MVPVDNPIAERRLTVVDDPGRSVVIAIGQPLEVQPGEWACPFTIRGIPEPRSDRGLGIDGVSALLNALHAIRFALEASGVRVSWEGGEPGDTGFPRLMHYAFGFAFSQRMEQLIDEEIQKLVDKKTRAGQEAPG